MTRWQNARMKSPALMLRGIQRRQRTQEVRQLRQDKARLLWQVRRLLEQVQDANEDIEAREIACDCLALERKVLRKRLAEALWQNRQLRRQLRDSEPQAMDSFEMDELLLAYKGTVE